MSAATMPESRLRPAAGAEAVVPYGPRGHGAPIVLDLASTAMAANSIPRWIADRSEALAASVTQYPDVAALTARLAEQAGVGPAQVLVTAGADEALERAFRAVLDRGDEVILTSPTFEMLPRYARLLGATIREVPWQSGELPVAAILAASGPDTRLIVVVSPNNPTGAVAGTEALLAVAAAVPGALLVVDLAYVEFAASDPTSALLAQPGVVVTRTFSKAWGLPGIRVGWAAGPAEVIDWMRRVGNPYTVSATSVALADAALRENVATKEATVRTVRERRNRLTTLLNAFGLDALPTEANFVCASPPRAQWLRDGMAGMGVAIRYLPDPEGDRVRITCPAGDQSWDMLERAIRTVMTPQALLFDMDGVLADVSRSYRQAIITTASSFGVEISAEDVARAKTAGNANDDWQLTANLMASRGVERPLAEVKERFEAFYQGAPGRPGLRETETLLVPADVLRRLSRRYQLGIATGRPRADAERFLSRFGLSGCFACCVTREDGPLKPDSFAVSDAMRQLGVERAWMFGDTPDDIRSARGAGALPVGVLPPENSATALEPALITAGAAWVLPSMTSLEGILP